MSPTALSLRLLRRRGFMVDVCERWVPVTGKNIRKDLFGAFDLVAVHLDIAGVLAVQTTSLSNLSARVAKLRELASVKRWLQCKNAVALHGWIQRGGKWQCKIIELRAEDMAAVVIEAPRRRRPNSYYQAELFDSLLAGAAP